jgi:hypothetical protein
MRQLFVATLVWLVALRLAWFAEFAFLAVKSSSASSWPRRIRDNGRRPAQLRGSERVAVAEYEEFKSLQTSVYTLGGLALAAWSIAAAASPNDSTGRFILAMLSVAVLTSLGATLVFRMAGSELSRMGYESGLIIASVATLSAVADLIHRTFENTWVSVGLVSGTVLILIRVSAESVTQFKLTKTLILPPARHPLAPPLPPP